MSGPVDVLHLLQIADVIACTTGEDEDVQWGAKFLEARVVVAGMIEALREIAEVTTPGDGVPNVEWVNARALVALSRVGRQP